MLIIHCHGDHVFFQITFILFVLYYVYKNVHSWKEGKLKVGTLSICFDGTFIIFIVCFSWQIKDLLLWLDWRIMWWWEIGFKNKHVFKKTTLLKKNPVVDFTTFPSLNSPIILFVELPPSPHFIKHKRTNCHQALNFPIQLHHNLIHHNSTTNKHTTPNLSRSEEVTINCLFFSFFHIPMYYFFSLIHHQTNSFT